MLNKKALSIKLNKSFGSQADIPLTPADQTLHTPLEAPGHNSYFGATPQQNSSFLYSNPQANESDDIMTDVDEPSQKVNRNYSITFTPAFDQLLMNVYTHIMSLPTTTPFSGFIPPSGIVSRVANETLSGLLKNFNYDKPQPAYDAQGVLNQESILNVTFKPIILQLIRKRLIDLCTHKKSLSKSSSAQLPAITSVSVTVAAHAPSINASNQANAQQANPVYNGSGLRQSSISNLSLNESNLLVYQQNQSASAQAAQSLNNSRSRSSSLSLRKHSLTRNNSYSGTNWLHVGNMGNMRPAGSLGMNPDLGSSTDSLQSMHDFVPNSLIKSANQPTSSGQGITLGATGGFNSMMMDYQTPPSSTKGSYSQGSTSPSASYARDASISSNSSYAGSISESEVNPPPLFRSRSSSRGTPTLSFPRPLTINTDAANFNHGNFGNFGDSLNGETLHSPFVSTTTISEDFGYFLGGSGTSPQGNVLGNVSSNVNGLRNGPLMPENSNKDANGNKISLPNQFSLSEKKRDSLKMKRGIH